MAKRAVRDYFLALRWQKIKESLKNKGWWWYVYFLTCLPLVLGAYKELESAITFYLLGFPLIFTMFLSVQQSMRLPKMMYLCPMSKEERKEYIIHSFVVRITVPIVINILCIALLILCGFCNPISALGMFISNVLFSIVYCSGINVNGYGRITEQGNRVIDIDTREHFLEVGMLLVHALIFAFSYGMITEGYADLPVDKILSIGLPLVIELPLTIAYFRHWNEAVIRTMTYER